MRTNAIVITAIIALVIIEVVAMILEFNGTLRMAIVAAIAGLAGWRIPTK